MPSRATGLTAAGRAPDAALLAVMQGARSADRRVIEMTRTGCLFLESDHGVESPAAEGRQRIGAATGSRRLAEAEVPELVPGTCTFTVGNAGVPYARSGSGSAQPAQPGTPAHQGTKTSVSGRGLLADQSKKFEVELKTGAHLWSRARNPTAGHQG